MNNALIYFPTLDSYIMVGIKLSLSESTGVNKLNSKHNHISNKLRSELMSNSNLELSRDDLDEAELIITFDSNKLICM